VTSFRHRLMRTTAVPPQFRVLYRWMSVLWMLLAVSLGLYAYGSALLQEADAARLVVPVLAGLVALAMLARLLVPDRPVWTRWALPLMGVLCMSTFMLSVFGAEGLGLTASRLGVCGLVLCAGLFAYTHWHGERVVVGR
jgi:peptidoglycan/LPS O-acetylase OafA/YrhL